MYSLLVPINGIERPCNYTQEEECRKGLQWLKTQPIRHIDYSIRHNVTTVHQWLCTATAAQHITDSPRSHCSGIAHCKKPVRGHSNSRTDTCDSLREWRMRGRLANAYCVPMQMSLSIPYMEGYGTLHYLIWKVSPHPFHALIIHESLHKIPRPDTSTHTHSNYLTGGSQWAIGNWIQVSRHHTNHLAQTVRSCSKQ